MKYHRCYPWIPGNLTVFHFDSIAYSISIWRSWIVSINVVLVIFRSSRGWCRAEAVSRLLSRSAGRVIVIKSESHYYLHELYDLFFRPIGEGHFTCCAMNHSINGQSIPCDKVAVARFMGQLITKKYLVLFSFQVAYRIHQLFWFYVWLLSDLSWFCLGWSIYRYLAMQRIINFSALFIQCCFLVYQMFRRYYLYVLIIYKL